MKRPQNLSSAPDHEVVTWARTGHEAAYRELVRRYERPVFSLIYRMVRDREKAEDLSQETFVKVLNALESYRPEFKFSSWIFKIANNAAIDHLRKRELPTLSIDGPPDPADRQPTSTIQVRDASESPLQELEAREIGVEIERAIGQLRPEYRSCVLLRYAEGHAYEEIAEILGLPLGTVKTYIHRARAELREALGPLRE